MFQKVGREVGTLAALRIYLLYCSCCKVNCYHGFVIRIVLFYICVLPVLTYRQWHYLLL